MVSTESPDSTVVQTRQAQRRLNRWSVSDDVLRFEIHPVGILSERDNVCRVHRVVGAERRSYGIAATRNERHRRQLADHRFVRVAVVVEIRVLVRIGVERYDGCRTVS